jgi:hypothetical protein
VGLSGVVVQMTEEYAARDDEEGVDGEGGR